MDSPWVLLGDGERYDPESCIFRFMLLRVKMAMVVRDGKYRSRQYARMELNQAVWDSQYPVRIIPFGRDLYLTRTDM